MYTYLSGQRIMKVLVHLHTHFVINAGHLVLFELCNDNSARRGAFCIGDRWLSRIDCRKGDYASVLEMDIGEQTERMGDGGWCFGTAVY
jgi:hypothetical protein